MMAGCGCEGYVKYPGGMMGGFMERRGCLGSGVWLRWMCMLWGDIVEGVMWWEKS